LLVFRVILAVTAVGLLLLVFSLLARSVVHGNVTARSLHVALARESRSADTVLHDDGRCRRTPRRGEWRCGVSDRSGSGGADYRVRMRNDSSCWRARRTGGSFEPPMPRRVSGCVYLWQWTLLSLLD
jgi:hypothetical protein